MLKKIVAADRHYNDLGWLQTYWLFSFSNYYDPENLQHGTLRVFNDDIVQPQTGFNTHPHEEMEIVSVILDGEMTHKDSMGNEILIKKGDVQRMTAGTGLQHSEWNTGNKPVSFFQIWILPDKRGLQPTYDQKYFDDGYFKNRLALIASGELAEEAVHLNTDAAFYRSRLIKDFELSYDSRKGYCQFIYVVKGHLIVNGEHVATRDQLRIQGEDLLYLQAHRTSDFLLIEIPEKSNH